MLESNSPVSLYEPTVLSVSGKAVNSSVTLEVYFDSESFHHYSLTTSINNTFKLQAEHIYHEPGRYRVTAQILGIEDTIVARTEVVVQDVPPFISGAGSTEQEPRLMYPWQRVTLRGIVPMTTKGVQAIDFKWTAYQLANGSHALKEFPLRLITETSSYLIISLQIPLSL